MANLVIDISVGSPRSLFFRKCSRTSGIATMAIVPNYGNFSVAAITRLMKQVALRADFDFLTQVYSRSGLYEVGAEKSPSPKQTQHLTVSAVLISTHFKSINDNYGQGMHDKVLSVFAQSIFRRLSVIRGWWRVNGRRRI